MANPQQPELARSRKTPALDPDATEAVLSPEGAPVEDRPLGRGHHRRPVAGRRPHATRARARLAGATGPLVAPGRWPGHPRRRAVEAGVRRAPAPARPAL